METLFDKYINIIEEKLKTCLDVFDQNLDMRELQQLLGELGQQIKKDTVRQSLIEVKKFVKGQEEENQIQGHFSRSSLPDQSSQNRRMTIPKNIVKVINEVNDPFENSTSTQ